MAERLSLIRVEPRWARTAAVSAGATLALNALLGAADKLPPVTEVCTPTTTTSQHTEPFETPEAYARHFAPDRRAGIALDHRPIEKAVAYIAVEEATPGVKVVKVLDIGYASAEDDAEKDGVRIGGFTTPSEKNLELADKRAHTHADLLFAEAAWKGTKMPPITFGTPVEYSLGKPDMDELNSLAVENKLDSAAILADVYNRLRPGKLDANTETALDNLLGAERHVETDITIEQKFATENCIVKHGVVPVVIPLFEAYMQAAPTTGPVPQHPNYARVETVVNPQWVPNKPFRINEPHPQGQGPKQIKKHISRTHGGDRGMKTNFPNKNKRRS